MKRLILAVAAAILTTSAVAQTGTAVKQSGYVTPGHALMWVTNGVAQDAGTAAYGFLTSLGVTASGPGICQNSAPITSGAWQALCLGVTTSGGATISLQNNGTAPQAGITFVINGTSYPFPYTVGGVIGPSTSVVNDAACWNNTVGSLLKDCGTAGTVTSVSVVTANGISGTVANSTSTPAITLSLGAITPTTITATSTTASTSTTTGSGIFGGGVGVAGSINLGGNINLASAVAKITIDGSTGGTAAQWVPASVGGEGNWFYANGGNSSATGNGNIAVGGMGAATAAITGFTGVGFTAFATENNATDEYSSALGDHACDLSSSCGSFSTFIGAFSGEHNTASEATFIGANSGTNNTSGLNTALGANSLAANVTGTNNVAVGYRALSASTASQNTALGDSTGFFNTSGSNNLFLGYATGYGIVTGSNNTILGGNVSNATGDVSDNIILATGEGTIRERFDGTNWNFNAPIKTPQLTGVTFAGLPASPAAGMQAYITDGKASNCGDTSCTTWGTTIAGGTGALQLQAWYNGTNWTLTGK